MIMIAHRKKQQKKCDEVWKIENGRLLNYNFSKLKKTKIEWEPKSKNWSKLTFINQYFKKENWYWVCHGTLLYSRDKNLYLGIMI